MIARKTGALIRSSLEIGALLAANEPPTIQAFARFGSCLGRAFQIRDDYLGIWGDEAATGKSTDNDLRRRKKSFPVVFALEQASGDARADLLRIYTQDSLDGSDIERVMEVLAEVGAPQYSEQLTQESAQQALEALEGVALPPWARTEIEELVDFLARRQF
jgi:geranylgeranyl diphosphate synthase type I